jgi:hypothetical protein
MSQQQLLKTLKDLKEIKATLEKAKLTNRRRIAYFEKKLAYIADPPQQFHLNEEVSQAQELIERIDANICKTNIDIGDIEQQIKDLDVKLPTNEVDSPLLGKSTKHIAEFIKFIREYIENQESDNEEENDVKPIVGKPKGDYTHLRELLDNEQWKEADLETTQILLKIAKRQNEGWLKADHIKQFSCADLNMIDQLWSKASQNRFGFKAQMTRWAEIVEEKKHWTENLSNFGDMVGWRENDNWLLDQKLLQFSLDAPLGHLPSLRDQTNDFGTFQENLNEFLSLLKTCCKRDK